MAWPFEKSRRGARWWNRRSWWDLLVAIPGGLVIALAVDGALLRVGLYALLLGLIGGVRFATERRSIERGT